MAEDSEIEVKLAVKDHRLFEAILGDPEVRSRMIGAEPTTRTFEAMYFDTQDQALRQAGFAYRIRREGDRWIATVKSDRTAAAGGLSDREEFSEEVSGPDVPLIPFEGTHWGDRLVRAIGGEKLRLLFTTRFTRTTLDLRLENGTSVELALDHGMIWGGQGGEPLCELELELKSGSVCGLLMFAGELAGRWHLLPELRSKYERGLDLLQLALPDVSGSAVPSASFSGPLDAAALLNRSVTEVLRRQEKIVLQGPTPENVRELRVHCRRLRSMIRFLQQALPPDEGRMHWRALSRWGDLLGIIRDIDVLLGEWDRFSVRYSPLFASTGWGVDVLRLRREFLADDITHRLEEGELTRQLFELQGWFSRPVDEAVPFDTMVQKALLQSLKDLRAEIGKLGDTFDMKALHRFRIRSKKLRYVLESFPAETPYNDAAVVKSLKKVQSLIGKLNDCRQCKGLLDQIEAGRNDAEFLLMKELFLCWRGQGDSDALAAVKKAAVELRKGGKGLSRALAALPTARRTKPRHDACAHEPSE